VKKLLLVALMVLMTTPAFAGLITYDSTATVSKTWMNTNWSTIYNDYNGNIDGDNIADGGVTSDDIATSANPLVRDNENIGEYVYTGLLPSAPASGLAMTTPAGTAYVTNDGDSTLHRVVTAATAKTYTASKDTYVYLDFTGQFIYEEVANDASQPTTPANSIILFKAVSDATDVTSITDYTQGTPSSLRVYQDYITGCIISRDADDIDKVNIGRGEIEFGSDSGKVRRNTAGVSINFATTGRGGLDTGTLAAGEFYYLFGVADDDTETAWEGIASLASSDATGVTGERLIGWCYANLTTSVSPDSVGAYKGRGSNQPNVPFIDIMSTDVGASFVPVVTLEIYTSGRPCVAHFTGTISASGGRHGNIKIEATKWGESAVILSTYQILFTAADNNVEVIDWYGTLPEGNYTLVLYGQASTTVTFENDGQLRFQEF